MSALQFGPLYDTDEDEDLLDPPPPVKEEKKFQNGAGAISISDEDRYYNNLPRLCLVNPRNRNREAVQSDDLGLCGIIKNKPTKTLSTDIVAVVAQLKNEEIKVLPADTIEIVGEEEIPDDSHFVPTEEDDEANVQYCIYIQARLFKEFTPRTSLASFVSQLRNALESCQQFEDELNDKGWVGKKVTRSTLYLVGQIEKHLFYKPRPGMPRPAPRGMPETSSKPWKMSVPLPRPMSPLARPRRQRANPRTNRRLVQFITSPLFYGSARLGNRRQQPSIDEIRQSIILNDKLF